ncbi:MAG: hypothetical protein RIC55_16515 [Pirellulaceae bacterium]
MAGKALCITGMVIAGLVTILFLFDLLLGLVGLAAFAPFQFASLWMDVIFVALAGGLGFLSWTVWKELI